MPEIFENKETQKINEEEQVLYLCHLLKVLKRSLLPIVTHEVQATVEDCLAAFKEHFAAIGGLVGPKTLENLKAGYYVQDDSGKNITCTVDTKAEKTVLNFGLCDQINIVNPLDAETEVRCVTNGMTMKIDSIYKEFMDAQVPLPELDVEWQGALFGTKKPDTTPQKRKATTHSPPRAGADPNAFASKSSVMLQDALRRKMSKRDLTATGSGASGSGSNSK